MRRLVVVALLGVAAVAFAARAARVDGEAADAPPAPPAESDDGAGRLDTTDWTAWFRVNRDARWPFDRLPPEDPLTDVSGAAAGRRSDAIRATEKASQELARPVLLYAMDPVERQRSGVRAAALVALARITRDPADVLRLRDAARGASEPIDVRESAALALGFLRRDDAERRFDARDYDEARETCFALFEDDASSVRLRSFAMFSLGVLGDMPTRAPPAEPGGAAASTTDRIYALTQARYAAAELPAAILLALSGQPLETIRDETREALRACALAGRLGRYAASTLTRAYATLALGRIGQTPHVAALMSLLTTRGTDADVQRAAAIGVGRLGVHLSGSRRAAVASDLLAAIEASSDASVKDFGIVALADLLAAEVREKRTDVLESKRPVEFLLRTALDGPAAARPFAALALGIVGREIGETPDVPVYGGLRVAAIQVLRIGLVDGAMDKRTRAAFATSLGILRDETSRMRLTATLEDAAEDPEVRAAAATALGLIGKGAPDVVAALKAALLNRSSMHLEREAAEALGRLGVQETAPLLLAALADSSPQYDQARLVSLMSRLGDVRFVQPFVDLVRSPKPDLTMAVACAGLGRLGDIDVAPAPTRLLGGLDYRAAIDAAVEVFKTP